MEQQKLAARTNVLKQLRLALISPTEAKYRLMGLGVNEKDAIRKVAHEVNKSIIPE